MSALHALDWDEVLERLRGLATSEAARGVLLALKPLAGPEEAQARFREILDAHEVLALGHRPHLESLDLTPTWTPRLKKNGVLKTIELKDVRSFCLEALALSEALKAAPNPWSEGLLAALMDAEEPLSAIDQLLTPSGEIRSDASETLHRLHGEKEKLAREVQNTLDRLVKDHDMEGLLQERFVTTREGRWVLPVKGGMQHHMPGVIHGTSQTKATVFMEPEKVIPLNNRLRQVEVEIQDEIERLLAQLSRYLSGRMTEIESTRALMQDADARFAQAQFTGQVEGAPCQFSEGEIELTGLRHPLLGISGKSVVANNVSLNRGKSILLLSGPNAGGKTVLLKSVGLAAQMARCGLPICASENSRLPFFADVLTGIGDAQSVDEELSTFAAHLKVLAAAAKLRGANHLVLIDEIAGSTDPEEGAALARSFIESFAANGVFAVVTSHLGPLKSGWQPQDRVLNGSMEYDPRSGRPTYHFISGIPGDSLAIQTARRIGIEKSIVDRAVEILSPATRKRLEALDELESLKSDIMVLQDSLRKETQAASALKKKYETQLAEFQKQKDDTLAKTVRKAEKKVEEAIQQAKVEDVFRRHRTLSDVKSQLPEIVKAKPVNLGHAADSADEFAKRYPPGTKIFVPSLNSDALVQSEPNAKGEVMVMSGSIRLQVGWQELRPPGKPQNPTAELVRRSGGFSVSLKDDDRTLDLRGKTVDEAIQELEIALDRGATQGEDRIKIIHGHGTEALKKAVRTYLSRSRYVKKWKAGTGDGGGDGVTWAELGAD